jgi:hypothetical protein
MMLRTIILQLSAQSPRPHATLEQQCGLCKNRTIPTYQHLLEVLDKLLSECERTYIVLDALDECKIEEHGHLVRFLSGLRQTTSPLHLLITSQPRKIFTDALGDVAQVFLELKSTEKDITLFVSAELRSERHSEQVQRRADEIAPKVVQKSNGM